MGAGSVDRAARGRFDPMDPVDRLQKMTKAIRRDLLEVLTAEPAARTDLGTACRDRTERKPVRGRARMYWGRPGTRHMGVRSRSAEGRRLTAPVLRRAWGHGTRGRGQAGPTERDRVAAGRPSRGRRRGQGGPRLGPVRSGRAVDHLPQRPGSREPGQSGATQEDVCPGPRTGTARSGVVTSLTPPCRHRGVIYEQARPAGGSSGSFGLIATRSEQMLREPATKIPPPAPVAVFPVTETASYMLT